jgi:hypothetical protein
MKTTDEDLQHQFELGDFSAEGIDAQAYRKVFDALQKEPTFSLPINFADQLVEKVESRERRKETSRDNLWLSLGLFSFFIALLTAIVLSGFKFSTGAFGFFPSHLGLVIFGASFVILLNLVDRKLVRKSTSY